MGKKGKTEVGTEVGKRVKKKPTQIWPYLCGILFNSFPNFTPDTQPLRLLKMIFHTEIRRENGENVILFRSMNPVTKC